VKAVLPTCRNTHSQYSTRCQLFQVHTVLPPPDDVDKGKFKEREEDEAGADNKPDVNVLDVAHLWQLVRSSDSGQSYKGKPVRVPSIVRPGTEFGSSQKETQLSSPASLMVHNIQTHTAQSPSSE